MKVEMMQPFVSDNFAEIRTKECRPVVRRDDHRAPLCGPHDRATLTADDSWMTFDMSSRLSTRGGVA